jgi:hypothetical protein
MVTDTSDISELLVEGRSSLISLKANDRKYYGLALKDGAILVRNGLMMPEVGGRTATSLFCDVRADKLDDIFKPVNIVGGFRGALALQGDSNYYHFMMFHLPKLLFLSMVQGNALTVVTSAGFPSVAENMVAEMFTTLAGGRPVTHTRVADGDYRLEDAVVPLRPDSTAAPLMCRKYVFPRALQKAGLTDPIAQLGPLKLFVRRAGSNRRNLSNQAEVEAWLTQQGYTAINPGEMPMEEQAIIFSRATHIVGVEGAALTNLLFAFNAKSVIMLASETTRDEKFFPAIAKHYPYTFATIYGETDGGARPTDRVADFSVPLSALQGALSF